MAQLNRYTYEKSDGPFSNPERGLFVYGGDAIDHSQGCWWNDQNKFADYVRSLDDGKSKEFTLVYLEYDLGAYRNAPQRIPQSYFQCIERDFDAAEARGFKIILRFSYNWRKKYVNDEGVYYDDVEDEEMTPNPCRAANSESNLCEASVAQILNHLGQNEFVDFIRANARRISVWQAGFLGKYGEWYYTSDETGIQDESNMPARVPVLKRMLEMLPDGIIQVRTPFYKEYAIRALPDTTNDDKNLRRDFFERIGVFDDSFFDDDQYSTFGNYMTGAPESMEYWKAYLSAQHTHVPVGGETSGHVIVNKPKSEADKQKVFAEFKKYHWSFFNAAKLGEKIDDMDWRVLYSDKEKRIQQMLGYRLYLVETEFQSEVQSGQDLSIKFSLANSGFAAPFKQKQIEVLACRKGSACKVGNPAMGKPDVMPDLRTWIPGEPIPLTVSLPTNGLNPGEYELYLRFGDTDPILKQRSVFSIQLANLSEANKNDTSISDVFAWNSDLGANKFGTVVIK